MPGDCHASPDPLLRFRLQNVLGGRSRRANLDEQDDLISVTGIWTSFLELMIWGPKLEAVVRALVCKGLSCMS